MVVQQNFRIAGTGSYLPQRCVTAEEIDQRAGLPAGWCRTNVGVATRYECASPETIVSMAGIAMERAMEAAKINWNSIGAIIDCSTTQFRPIPCNAAHYQQKFSPAASGIPCFDIQSTCLGAIVALNLINGLFAANSYEHIMLVAAESGLGGVNYTQPESACLIGDGAAALVLRREFTMRPLFYAHETYADHLELCRVEGGGHKLPVFEYAPERRHEYQFFMDGPAVFRVALKQLKPMVVRLMNDWQSQGSEYSQARLQVIPHQASPRALDVVRAMLGFVPVQFHTDVTSLGNMVAASIPVMLDRVIRDSRIVRGQPLMLLGTSAGYSQAAMILEY